MLTVRNWEKAEIPQVFYPHGGIAVSSCYCNQQDHFLLLPLVPVTLYKPFCIHTSQAADDRPLRSMYRKVIH